MTASNPDARVVLVVDDDADIREILAELLEGEGYVVGLTANGREALEYLQTFPRPDVVVLDIMMPVMDGWEFLARRERDEYLSAIPVIIASANLDLTRTATVPLADRLAKPFDAVLLLDAVAKWTRGTGTTP